MRKTRSASAASVAFVPKAQSMLEPYRLRAFEHRLCSGASDRRLRCYTLHARPGKGASSRGRGCARRCVHWEEWLTDISGICMQGMQAAEVSNGSTISEIRLDVENPLCTGTSTSTESGNKPMIAKSSTMSKPPDR